MSSVSRAALYEASFSICRQPEEHGFIRRPEPAFDLRREPVTVTGTYMTGDPEGPLLKQASLLCEATTVLEASPFVLATGELAVKNLPFIPDQEMRVMCEKVKETVDEIELTTEERDFEMIAVHAVYELLGSPVPQTFISRSVVDSLGQKIHVEIPEDDDTDLREQYAVQAEHNPDIEPFEEWAAIIKQLLSSAGTAEQMSQLAAENFLNWLVVPRPNMHPLINSLLFEVEAAQQPDASETQ